MIPRTLVPRNVRPVDGDELKKAPRRVNTYLDDRTVVPSELSDAPPLDGKTTIPSHLPLDVLVNRTLVPRGMPAKAIEHFEPITEHVPIAVLDSRVVVPAYVEPLAPEEIKVLERPPEMTEELREIVEPDIFTTGDPNLLIEPEEKKTAKSELIRAIGSITFHALLILFLIFAPKLIPAPTQQPIGDNLDTHWMYSPPETPAPAKPTPKLNVNRETLNKVAPPEIKPPAPAPEAPKPTPELPEAPKPKPSVALAQPQPQPSAIPQPPVQPRLEPVLPAQPNNHFITGLDNSSPGKLLGDQMQSAAREGRPGAVYGGGPPAGGGGQGLGMNNGAEILSDTQGVDFSAYIRRLLATLKRNWEYVMPESARMGDRGVVYTEFQINPDGSVPPPDPTLDRTSGKEPLDNAAMAAIHASNPFEPLPKEFHGPYLRLRIIFIYNIPPDQVNLH